MLIMTTQSSLRFVTINLLSDLRVSLIFPCNGSIKDLQASKHIKSSDAMDLEHVDTTHNFRARSGLGWYTP